MEAAIHLPGVEFQRKLEENAYREGNGKVPVQLFGDFCKNIPSQKLGDIIPQIKGMYRLANVRRIFPEIIADSLQEGVAYLIRSFLDMQERMLSFQELKAEHLRRSES